MPIPSSLPPPGAPAAPGTLSSPLESRVGPWPAVLFLASLLAVVYLVRGAYWFCETGAICCEIKRTLRPTPSERFVPTATFAAGGV